MNTRRATGCLLFWVAAVYCVGCCAPSWAADATGDSQTKAQFENVYSAWLTARASWIEQNGFRSSSPAVPELQPILDMGAAEVPFLIDKFDDEQRNPHWDSRLLADNLSLIFSLTMKRFTKADWPLGKDYGEQHALVELYVHWWKQGRKETPQKLTALYAKWDQLAKDGHKDEAAARLEDVRSMGIEAVPFMFEKIRAGDERLVPLASRLMRQQLGRATPTKQSVLVWWEANKDKLQFPSLPDPKLVPDH